MTNQNGSLLQFTAHRRISASPHPLAKEPLQAASLDVYVPICAATASPVNTATLTVQASLMTTLSDLVAALKKSEPNVRLILLDFSGGGYAPHAAATSPAQRSSGRY